MEGSDCLILAFLYIVLEVKDETISVASAFPGHQEGMKLFLLLLPSSFLLFFFSEHYILLVYQLYRIETTNS